MRRGVYHGTTHPQLLGKSALIRDPRTDRCEPEGVVMAQFDDLRIPQAFGWWPILPAEITLYPANHAALHTTTSSADTWPRTLVHCNTTPTD